MHRLLELHYKRGNILSQYDFEQVDILIFKTSAANIIP